MSIVISYSVGDGDMFSITHNSDNFTMIDTHMSDDNREWIVDELERQGTGKGIQRFVSTHPDQDHLGGLKYLDEQMELLNFYCIENKITKENETDDFKQYKKLRDSDKAFYLYKGCTRRWMNQSSDERGSAGLFCLWPDRDNADFKAALDEAEDGGSPNNTSIIVEYKLEDGVSFLWMGDMETDFMEKIEDHVDWPDIDILFAPHHGRSSATVPSSILGKMDPKIIVLGEAPSEHLQYYPLYETITQNSAGSIVFEIMNNYVHVYVTNVNYSVNFLENLWKPPYKACKYLGSLSV